MKYSFSFLVVIALALISGVGSQMPGMGYFFGVAIPYMAFAIFVGGIIWRIKYWASSPVPFSIQSTRGQAKSLDFIKHSRLGAPDTNLEVVGRVALETLTFRPLFFNTHSELRQGPKITFESSKWLWLFALIFHYSFLVVVVRHLRLFLDPVPFWVGWAEFWDGLLQIGAPTWYITDVGLLLGVILLFGRRLTNRYTRYISLINDYFPLVLIFCIALTGILMRYLLRSDIDIVNIKELLVGLVTFHPVINGHIGAIFYIHLFFVCVLLVYFPFSKLMHMGGIFFSPTLNMRNNTRAERHINPWNPVISPHSYMSYEDEFRESMVENGIPVEKGLPEEEPEAEGEAEAAEKTEE